MTKGEAEFLDQYTRSLCVQWAVDAMDDDDNKFVARVSCYLQHAAQKKWIRIIGPVGGGMMCRMNSAGWGTASRFLKR